MAKLTIRPTPHRDALKKFHEADPGRRDSIVHTGAQTLMSLAVAEALSNHAIEVFEATENIILELQRQAENMGKQTDKVVGAMDEHKDALTRAALGSEKYAKRLMWATWALVAATVALVYATFTLNH